MDLSLRPATVEALQRFKARHNALIWRRAALLWLACGIAFLLLIALLDRAGIVPDAALPWLTLTGYAACVVAAWKTALRFLQPAGDQIESARIAEQVAPEVREKLLAAVELSRQDPGTVSDSPEFRARLQDEVAAAVKDLNWTQRLPATSLKPWALRLAMAVTAVVVLSFVPMLHLPGFLERAALPFANLERPSSVQIVIETPAAAASLAPIGSEVDVAVSITGDSVDHAFLEYGEPSASLSKMELGKMTPQRFEGRLPVGQGDVRFRIRASDGLTAWHTITAKARPRITSFTKTIVPPAYAGGVPVTVTEDHGDIEVVQGSTLKLAMRANQYLKEARLLLNPDMPTHPTPPPVLMQDDGSLAASLYIDGRSENWTMRLKSDETGFSNDESASWRITLIPDLPPIVQITDPLQQQVSLLPDETLRLAGTASDDVGLKTIQASQSLNGDAWKTIDLVFTPGKQATVQYLLALASLQVKAGDTVLVKLVAIDSKGQKAESAPLRIIVLEQTVDPSRRAWASETRRLAEMAKTLEDKTKELNKAMSMVQKVARQEKSGKPVTDEAHAQLARVKQQVERAQEQATDLWEQLKKAAQTAPTRLNAEEAHLLGEKVAQLRHESLKNLEDNTRDGVDNPEILKRDANQAFSNALILHEAAQAFAAEETAKITEQATRQNTRQQALLTDTSLNGNRDQSQRGKWQEQQRAALAANAQLKEEFAALRQEVHGGHQANLDRMQKEITEAANDLNESLDKPPAPALPGAGAPQPPQTKSPEHLYGASDNLRQRLSRSADAIHGISEEAGHRAADMRQRLQTQENPALAAIDQAKNELLQAAQVAKDPKHRDKQQKRDGLTHEERAGQNLATAARQLQDQGELREQNPLTNTQAALDANRASRATEKLREDTAAAADPSVPADLEAVSNKSMQLAKIVRTLDAEELTRNALDSLADAALPQASAGPPDLGKNAESATQAAEQLRQLPQALRRAESKNELAGTAQQAADQARNGSQQLQEQARQASLRQPNQPEPATPPPPQGLAEAESRARQVSEALAPQADAARQQLAQLAPKVSDMMKTMAKNLHETQKATEAAKLDADAQKPVAEVAQKAQDIQPEAAKNADKMQALQAALRQEANAAELAKADQRQLARTADVALEQMRQKSPEIAQNLRQAAKASQSQPQSQALQKAAQAQQNTAEALQQLADNFAQMEKGEEVPQDALAKLEEMEKDLGVEQPLDEAYDKAKFMADVSQDAKNDPQKALSELEKQLARNPAMQKALADIAKDTAQKSEQQLKAQANQPAMLGTAAEDAGNQLERVARHEQRLGQKDAFKDVKEASAKINATAKATKTEPGNATPQVAQEATAAAQSATKSAEQAAAATPPQPNVTAFEQNQAHALAQALDQLDAQMHPLNGAPQEQQAQQGQQQQGGQQPQQNQQSAQQSMAQAQKSQQQSMAQARAEGKVPGQSQGSGKQQNGQAAGKGQPKPDSSQSPEEGGNFANTTGEEGMPVQIKAVLDGNWGKLPARMAEDLTEATRQEAAPEYRAAIENYYKAIAGKAKK
ncbi:MAG: hypothetical protein JWO94_3032 [Verrucomicrobiaceae bacterium]|nr:hypothetical protein [Verrucomicrobiaceae bacterium]